MKTKTKMENKKKAKTKMKIKMNFCFCFHFGFHFRFCFFFLKVFEFLLTPRGLELPWAVNCLLIGLKCDSVSVNYTWPRGAIDGQFSRTWPGSAIAYRFRIFHLAQRCHSTQKYGTICSKNKNYHFKLKFAGQPNSNIQNSMMLFTFLTENALFGQIWSKLSML